MIILAIILAVFIGEIVLFCIGSFIYFLHFYIRKRNGDNNEDYL